MARMANTKQNPSPARGPTSPRPSSTAHRTLAKPNPLSSWKGRAAGLCWRCCSTSVLFCAPCLPLCVCLCFNCSPPPPSTQSAVGDGIVHIINANPAGLIPSCLLQAINPGMHSPRVSHANRGLPRTEEHLLGPFFMRFCETAFGGWRGERAVLGSRLTRRSDTLGLFMQNLAN